MVAMQSAAFFVLSLPHKLPTNNMDTAIRKNFGKLTEAIDPPNLLQNQVDSSMNQRNILHVEQLIVEMIDKK